jgi:hypothetical protein
MTARVDNDAALERALDEAAVAFLCCLAKNATDASTKIMRERIIAVVRLRDGVVGKYVKVRVLRETLEAVSERSLAIYAEEFKSRIRQRLSRQMADQVAEAVQNDLARIFRKACVMIEGSIPTLH